jgi:hypothetical protein
MIWLARKTNLYSPPASSWFTFGELNVTIAVWPSRESERTLTCFAVTLSST